MHPVLYIDELVRVILAYCGDDDVSGATYRGTLYHAALTCKALHAPAVDLLWSHLPSVMPLMNLIPGLYCEEGRYTLDRYMTTREKDVFRSYAARVKSLTQHRPFPLDSAAVTTYCAPFFLPHTPLLLLPALGALHLSAAGCASPAACVPLSPALRDLRIRADGAPGTAPAADAALCAFLARARTAAPQLARITLRGRPCARTSALLASMSGLQALSLRSGRALAPATLAALATFPRLTALAVRADHIALGALAPPPPGAPPLFPALAELAIHARAPLIADVLARLVPGRLRTLALDVVADSDDDDEDADADATAANARPPARPDWPALLALVAAQGAGLRTLTIEHHPAYASAPDPARAADRLTLGTLRPLTALRHLEHVALDLGLPWDLADADVAALAACWPALARLALDAPAGALAGAHGWTWRPRATLCCLAELSARLPRLAHLALALDVSSAASLAPLDAPAPDAASQHALRSLWIASGSGPRRPKDVARYLHTLFPALEEVDEGQGDIGAWEEVHGALRVLQGISED